MSDLDPYDQYEVSVPLEIAGTCLTQVSICRSHTARRFPSQVQCDVGSDNLSWLERSQDAQPKKVMQGSQSDGVMWKLRGSLFCHVLQASALWKTGLGEGFRVPALLRFVSEEDPYLGQSSGGPRMYLNMEDHVSHTTKTPNVPFEVRPAAPDWAYPNMNKNPYRRWLKFPDDCL